MTYVKLTRVRTFPGVKPTKAQALKVLEEAAEVVEAWKGYREVREDEERTYGRPHDWSYVAMDDLLDEIADTVQACCNLAAALGVTDLTPYLARYEERNRERGRYE